MLSLFTTSLSQGGFLCLGIRESLDFCSVKPAYHPISLTDRIWRKTTRFPIEDDALLFSDGGAIIQADWRHHLCDGSFARYSADSCIHSG